MRILEWYRIINNFYYQSYDIGILLLMRFSIVSIASTWSSTKSEINAIEEVIYKDSNSKEITDLKIGPISHDIYFISLSWGEWAIIRMDINYKVIWSKVDVDPTHTYGQLIKDYLFIDLSEQYAYIISKDTNSILRLRANNGDFVDHFRL